MFNYKADILDFIQEIGISVTDLSKATGISKDKMYQWKAGNGQPKSEDSEKLKKWKNDYLNNNTLEIRQGLPGEEVMDVSTALKSIFTLVESNKLAIENNSKLVETNNRLIDRLLSLETPVLNPGQKVDEALQAEIDKRHGVQYMKGLDKAFSDMPETVQRAVDKKKRS